MCNDNGNVCSRDSRSASRSSNVAEYVIESAQPSDSGVYSCIAQNSAGPVEDRVQLFVSEDVNEISGGESGGPSTSPYEDENRTPGQPRGDIPGSDETGIILNVRPDDDLVNAVGTRAVLTCNAGTYTL